MIQIDSGRFNPKLKNTQIKRAFVTDGLEEGIKDRAVAVYRVNNEKDIDTKTIENVRSLIILLK